MSWVWAQVLGGLRLVAEAAMFYVTAPIVLAVAAVPAAIRTYQLFSGNDDGWLELLVETLRIVLIAVLVAVGRAGVDAAGSPWVGLWKDVAHAYRSGWSSILVQLTVVTVVVVTFNVGVDSLVSTTAVRDVLGAFHLAAGYAEQAAVAAIFAVKNFVVIPIYLVSLLMASEAIRRRGPRRPPATLR